MKYFALVLLVIFTQPLPPLPRQTVNKQAEKANQKSTIPNKSSDAANQTAPTRERSTSEYSTYNTYNYSGEASPESPKHSEPWSRTDIIGVVYDGLTGLLVVVAAATGCLIWKQTAATAKATQAMRESVDATKAKERARILVQQPAANLPDLIQIMEKDMPYYRIPIPLFHHGSTDAFNVKMFGNAFTDKERAAPFSAKEEVFNIPAFIRPQQKAIVAHLTAFYPEDDQKKVESGELSFHVCGKITYDDIYGKLQETIFWYVWDMEVYEMGAGAKHEYQSWKLNGAPEYNRAT